MMSGNTAGNLGVGINIPSGSMHSEMSSDRTGGFPAMTPLQFDIEASPVSGLEPESLDLGWQFMQDLRPYM
jgi:hypothetical protein